MRLMASCNQVARACWSSGAILPRNALRAHTTMRLEDGRGNNCGSVFCSFLALSDSGGFAHQTSDLHAERGGDLDVNELIGVLDTSFGDSHVHSRAVFGVDGRVVH